VKRFLGRRADVHHPATELEKLKGNDLNILSDVRLVAGPRADRQGHSGWTVAKTTNAVLGVLTG